MFAGLELTPMYRYIHCKIVSPTSTNKQFAHQLAAKGGGGPLLLTNTEEGQSAVGHLMTRQKYWAFNAASTWCP